MYSWEQSRMRIWRNVILLAVLLTLILEFARVAAWLSGLAVLSCLLLGLGFWLTIPMPVAIIQATVRKGGERPELYIVDSCAVGSLPLLRPRPASALITRTVVSFTADLAQPAWNEVVTEGSVILTEVRRLWPQERTWRWSPSGEQEPAVTLRRITGVGAAPQEGART